MRSYLIDRMDAAQAKASAAHAEQAEAVADFMASDEWCLDGATDVASWMCARYQMSRRRAVEIVRDAEELAARPALRAALASGSISVDQCKAITVLSEEGTDDAEVWLEALAFWTYPELEREARKKKARDLERRDGGTYFRMFHTPDERFMRGEFQLHPEDGALVQSAVESLIPAGTRLRDVDRAGAVALVDLAKGAQSPGSARPLVLLSTSTTDVASLHNGGFVGTDTARRMSCDARIQEVHIDADGRVVGTAANAAPIPSATRRAVEARDGYRCTFPGCAQDRFLECHHIVHREHGGSNTLSNLQMVCWKHHVLVHEGGWSLGDAAGVHNTWFRPDGSVFEPRVRVTLDTS